MFRMASLLVVSWIGVVAALLTDLMLSHRRLARAVCSSSILLIAAVGGVLLGRAAFESGGMFAPWAASWAVFTLGIPFLLGRWLMHRLRAGGTAPLRALAAGLSVGIVTGWFLLPFAVGMLLALLIAG